MSTLFVDCNHTLAIEPAHIRRGRAETWQANLDVVAAVERWQRHDNAARVVLWSERGADDAEIWRRRLLPHLERIECLAKDARVPRTGDVLIDNTTIKAKGTRYPSERAFMVAPDPIPGQPPPTPVDA